ncbi:MAG TPA: DNA repair protein RadA [Patescibacteria group bacterium]|nr:DNA repair protein RadA [Patescibacteria group bacterium]
MPKQIEKLFTCTNCGAQYQKWTGKCLECGKWGTVLEEQPTEKVRFSGENESQTHAPLKISELNSIKAENFKRFTTNNSELDRVLGGGIVPGSLILLGGEPGIGKSTLALQIAITSPNCLYFSGEESAEQIKLRSERLKLKNVGLRLASATNIDSIIATINSLIKEKNQPGLVIVDSIQTVYTGDIEGSPGNVNQVRACTTKLMDLAKTSGVTVVIIGQVTKEGTVAGPKTLEHLVDTVLYLEGDRFHEHRILRAAKNRFGSIDEVGVFAMEETGLKEVKSPSAVFLAERGENVPGSVITCLLEGTRPILVEVQALVTKTNFGYPQRRASGFDLNRLQVLIGVLSRRAGLPLDSYDVFLNVVGGLQAEEPAADLAVILAIASGIQNKTLPKNLAAFGEVGLGGEVRSVNQSEKRLTEIKNMGFEFAVIPTGSKYGKTVGLKLAPIKNVQEILEKVLNK